MDTLGRWVAYPKNGTTIIYEPDNKRVVATGIYRQEDAALIAAAPAMQTELRLMQGKLANMDGLTRRLAWAVVTLRRSQEDNVIPPTQALDIADECELAMVGRCLGVTLRGNSYGN